MYKYIGIIALSLVVATSAQAGKWNDNNCTNKGGTIVKTNEYDPNDPSKDKGGYCATYPDQCNGMEFCVSNKAMNWWSAITWCEAHGGKLASFASLCPNTVLRDDRYTVACYNIANIRSNSLSNRFHTRTTQGLSASQNWIVVPNGVVGPHNRKGEDHTAICE